MRRAQTHRDKSLARMFGGGLALALAAHSAACAHDGELFTDASNRPPGVLFFDDFESGDLTHTENGVSWAGSNAGAGDDLRVSELNARAGRYALEFTFGGGPDGDDAWSEQRWNFGNRYPEMWLRWDTFVPANFTHRSQDNIGSPANNSLLFLWGGDTQWAASVITWPTAGDSRLTYGNSRPSQGLLSDPVRPDARLFAAADRGTWITITVHMRLATVANNDGEIRLWKRRASTGTDELLFARTGLPIYNASGNFMEFGYVLGWSNSGFLETTIFYVDNFTLSTTPLELR